MKAKLPEGVPVWIVANQAVEGVIQIIHCNEEKDSNLINGLALTFEQLAELKKAIARAAFEAGADNVSLIKPKYNTADDYLQSEQFKKLVGEM